MLGIPRPLQVVLKTSLALCLVIFHVFDAFFFSLTKDVEHQVSLHGCWKKLLTNKKMQALELPTHNGTNST